jgi:hypothetical protein
MRVWTTSGRKSLAIAGLLLAFAAPTSAFASVQFTEVMYDAPGNDTGREWLEITNMGSSSVDLYGYKLFEGGVNHNVILTAGTTTLAAGESAIIAANAQKFLTDYPAYSGPLFKSSFSLNNTSESVILKDNKLMAVDSLGYSSSMGASGDGNSLHLENGAWVPGAPNPGSSAPSKAIVKPASVVIAPAVKTAAAISKTSTTKKYASYTSSNNFNASAPLIPNISSAWLCAIGLGALIALGIGAALYAKPPASLAGAETGREAEEFELE